MNADAGEGVEMVRALQKLDKGINEKLREEHEPMLLDGIKLDVDQNEEENQEVILLFEIDHDKLKRKMKTRFWRQEEEKFKKLRKNHYSLTKTLKIQIFVWIILPKRSTSKLFVNPLYDNLIERKKLLSEKKLSLHMIAVVTKIKISIQGNTTRP